MLELKGETVNITSGEFYNHVIHYEGDKLKLIIFKKPHNRKLTYLRKEETKEDKSDANKFLDWVVQ